MAAWGLHPPAPLPHGRRRVPALPRIGPQGMAAQPHKNPLIGGNRSGGVDQKDLAYTAGRYFQKRKDVNLTSVSSPLRGADCNSILTPHTRSGKCGIVPVSCPPALWDALPPPWPCWGELTAGRIGAALIHHPRSPPLAAGGMQSFPALMPPSPITWRNGWKGAPWLPSWPPPTWSACAAGPYWKP